MAEVEAVSASSLSHIRAGTPEAADAEAFDAEPEQEAQVTQRQHDAGQDLVTINAEGKRVRKVIRKKRRPARPQVDPSTFKTEPPPQTGTIFNIWYNKWSGGDREDAYLSKHAAPSRCHVSKDSGYTRADNNPGSYFCLFFARGLCPRGRDCEYLHRLPDKVLDVYSGNVDCFGREKHSDYRDDMGGVGSFTRQNRTLYVGRIHPTDDIEEVVARHFNEWGPIERIRVLPTRGVAFVTYTTESLAQFAKEAMAHQSLDHEEILNVRWATQDPNPAAQKREARAIEEQAANAIRRALPESFVREMEGRDPEAKRRRREEGKFGLEGYEASDQVWFEHEKARLDLEDTVRSNDTLEAPPQRPLLTNSTSEGAEIEGNGILSNSTLTALETYKTTSTDAIFAQSTRTVVSGPLVGYDSDDDEDSS